jgi:hypothetical protein
MEDVPLFKSAHAAVTFALHYSNTDHVERSPVSKASDTHKGSGGKGLIGLDGAAQAGMILSVLKSIGELHEAPIISRVSKKRLPCNCGSACCSGYKPNWAWRDSIRFLATEMKSLMDKGREEGKRGVTDNPAMRQAIVAKYFGESVKINELAKACEVSDVTVASHLGKINRLLKKIEGEAWEQLEDQLRAKGVVGDY